MSFGSSSVTTDHPQHRQNVLLAIVLVALGGWLLFWSAGVLWTELSNLIDLAPLVELQASAAIGLPIGVALLALLAAMTAGARSAACRKLGMAVAVGALPFVLILPAALLLGGGGYLAGKGHVDCPDEPGSRLYPVIRKVRPESLALCTTDGPVQ